MSIETIHTNAIIRELPTSGHSPLLVLGSNYEMYVAKNDKGNEPPFALINECVAAYFLKKWSIPAPVSKLVYVAEELIKAQNSLSVNHKPHYYQMPCFGSKFVENSVDLSTLLITDKKKTYGKIANPLDVFRITLFDTWVENDDRKPTNYNLILEPNKSKFTVLPIDHAFIFSTMSYKDLNPDYGVSVSINDHLLVSDLGKLVKKYTFVDKSFIQTEREYFYLCVEKCKENFDNFLKQVAVFYSIDPASINTLKAFLFSEERNHKVFNEYVFRLQQ